MLSIAASWLPFVTSLKRLKRKKMNKYLLSKTVLRLFENSESGKTDSYFSAQNIHGGNGIKYIKAMMVGVRGTLIYI